MEATWYCYEGCWDRQIGGGVAVAFWMAGGTALWHALQSQTLLSLGQRSSFLAGHAAVPAWQRDPPHILRIVRSTIDPSCVYMLSCIHVVLHMNYNRARKGFPAEESSE